MEPQNKGHIKTRSFREVLYLEVKIYWYNSNWDEYRFVLFREVFFIWSVLYRRFPQQVPIYSYDVVYQNKHPTDH